MTKFTFGPEHIYREVFQPAGRSLGFVTTKDDPEQKWVAQDLDHLSEEFSTWQSACEWLLRRFDASQD